MIPIKQHNHHNPEAGVYGDCFRAAIASVLELALDDVPHFLDGNPPFDQWGMALKTWACARNLNAAFVVGSADLDDTLSVMAAGFPEMHYILCGTSRTLQHAVVGYGDKVVHNPGLRADDGTPALTAPLYGGRYVGIAFRPLPAAGAPAPVLPAVDFEPLTRHERIGVLFSGGKDSLALVYLLHPYWHQVTFYHCDTGELLPETRAVVGEVEAMVPRFVRIATNPRGWIAQHGRPSDIVPNACTPLGRKQAHGDAGGVSIADRFQCCADNLWFPIQDRMVADGITLEVRGTRRSDTGYGLLANSPGKKITEHSTVFDLIPGREVWLPIGDWSDDGVFAYLRSVGAPIARYYQHNGQGPECATCPAWWGWGRGAYLNRYHPNLAAEYRCNLQVLRQEILKPLMKLEGELDALARV